MAVFFALGKFSNAVLRVNGLKKYLFFLWSGVCSRALCFCKPTHHTTELQWLWKRTFMSLPIKMSSDQINTNWNRLCRQVLINFYRHLKSIHPSRTVKLMPYKSLMLDMLIYGKCLGKEFICLVFELLWVSGDFFSFEPIISCTIVYCWYSHSSACTLRWDMVTQTCHSFIPYVDEQNLWYWLRRRSSLL